MDDDDFVVFYFFNYLSILFLFLNLPTKTR